MCSSHAKIDWHYQTDLYGVTAPPRIMRLRDSRFFATVASKLQDLVRVLRTVRGARKRRVTLWPQVRPCSNAPLARSEVRTESVGKVQRVRRPRRDDLGVGHRREHFCV